MLVGMEVFDAVRGGVIQVLADIPVWGYRNLVPEVGVASIRAINGDDFVVANYLETPLFAEA